MKRQVILDNNQLIEIVNESAKRTLRSLMTEDQSIWQKLMNTLGVGGGDIDDYIEQYGNGQNEAMLRQIGPENLQKLAESNPEAFQVIAQDPMTLARIAGNPDVASKMAEDPTFMTKLATNPNVQSAFFANGPEQAMNFFSDQNMVNMMNNPNIDAQTRAQMYGMMNGQVAMDPMMLQNVMTQYAPNPTDNTNGWLGSIFGINQSQPQMMPQQAAMMMQQAGEFNQEIMMMQNQIAQMEQSDPNNPSLGWMKQNLGMMQQQMQMFAPAYKATQDRYNTLMTKMQSGGMLTPQEMQEFQMSSKALMNANMTGISQYYPQQSASAQTSGNNSQKSPYYDDDSGQTSSSAASKNQQQQGGFFGNLFNNINKGVLGVVNKAGAAANQTAQQKQQQQRQQPRQRRQATPAAPTATAAATTPATTAATATPATPATPTPQTPAQNQLQQTQQIQQTLANSPMTQNRQVAGYNTNMTLQNPQGVKLSNQYTQRLQQPPQQYAQQQQQPQQRPYV